ncbi:MAG: DUF554 domain-containing protein [Oscillospiraceae bacterium]|nr:DUF554 domain-containing protein [Oscillospiraceae bacterium]
MAGLGTLVNVFAILVGGAAGLILKRFLSKRITDTVMQGVGLAIIVVGLSGALSAAFIVLGETVSSRYILTMIISLAIGALLGELIGIESKLDAFARFCEKKFARPGETGAFAQGFVTAALVFCVGSMAIIGSIEEGVNKNSDILFAKSALDGIIAMILSSTMGIGVLFSAITVGVYQGVITLLAIFIAPYISLELVTQISLIGSVLIMSIGMNLLKIAKIKTGNLLPAIFIPVIYYLIRLLV